MKVSPDIYVVKIEETCLWSCESQDDLNKKIDKFSKFDFIELNDVTYKDGESYYQLMDITEYVVSREQMVDLAVANIKFNVKQKVDVSVDITSQLIELSEKPIKILTEGSGSVYNQKVDVHMPGNMLSIYNEAMILEDCCTDILASKLNSGWRIIAACPQPDQRRPDYVLGRFNPDIDLNGSASRSA